ncbi:MAG: hypothetical protein COZ18_14495 [Flexibacter sp. CG_4_10_14_3_um_filter_32_15]|nr:MAG: hypothetical protein COZ18_14495 [Flexibacter sp. CG_4_10_14_3_um_filter_32_15]
MNQPKYLYKSEPLCKHFEFISEGVKGKIRKMVEYTETDAEGIYNLGFGDYDEKTKTIDDINVTNNGDSQKVLATVASTIYSFIKKYPNATIFATGSTKARTRLYRMGISNNLEEITKDFEVLGFQTDNEEWENFVIGKEYAAFLITKKQNNEIRQDTRTK